MRALNSNPNVDNSDLSNYPDGRVKDNTGSGNGTGVNERVYGDLHQAIAKLMRLYGIIPSGLPDNEANGFQIVEALKALASKNDYIYPLSSVDGVLNVDIKFANMQNGEFIVCRASVDKTTETQIKGIGATNFSITYSGSFKTNEYVRVIKTSGGISIVRLADWNSLSAMATDLGFLKKATYLQEIDGTLDTVATTPLNNALAFVERVNGLLSAGSLASAIRNGLYPKEHFTIVAGLGASPVKNIGWFSGLDVGASGSLPVSGNITSAVATILLNGESNILVTFQNPMQNVNYFVRIHLESQGSFSEDNNILTPVFVPFSTTQCKISMNEIVSGLQSLKVHLEVVQL